MLAPVYTLEFGKDIKRAKKQGKNLEKIKIIIGTLLQGQPLDAIHRDHKLIGSYQGRRGLIES
jgi:mRNA interferase YafQ